MSKLPIEYLKHIQDEFDYLSKNSAAVDKDKFMTDVTLQKAFTRSLEIVGEAVKNLPDDFRSKHSSINWKSMAGMRDKLIHHYFGIDYEIVWDVAKNESPKLKEQINNLIQELQK